MLARMSWVLGCSSMMLASAACTEPARAPVGHQRAALVGAEQPIDAPVVGLASGFQSYPAIATDGTDYLVAWRDDREAPERCGVYAARVDASGRVLDPTG